jgi:hypothetical protein
VIATVYVPVTLPPVMAALERAGILVFGLALVLVGGWSVVQTIRLLLDDRRIAREGAALDADLARLANDPNLAADPAAAAALTALRARLAASLR